MLQPATRRTAVAAALHHAYELGAGAGIPAQSVLRLPGAVAMWGVAFPAWWLLAARRSPRAGLAFAFLDGMSLAGVLVHFLGWRWRLVRGIPVAAPHGLPDPHLLPYNVVLWLWAGCALDALHRETPPGTRRYALLALATTPPLIAAARAESRWIAGQARHRPSWWNRGLRPQAGS